MLRAKGEAARLIYDHHVYGVFARDRWLALFRQAGFQPEIRTVVHSEFAPAETELFLCRRPG